jgi:hypothetical protein
LLQTSEAVAQRSCNKQHEEGLWCLIHQVIAREKDVLDQDGEKVHPEREQMDYQDAKIDLVTAFVVLDQLSDVVQTVACKAGRNHLQNADQDLHDCSEHLK